MRPSRSIAVALLAPLAVLAACSGDTAPRTPKNIIVQAGTDRTFQPREITISRGDTVTWVMSTVPHNVIFQQEGDSATYYGGKSSTAGAPTNVPRTISASASRVFTTRGTFEYRCSIHSGMNGEITVQ